MIRFVGCLVALSLSLTACNSQDNARWVPDRQGHAYVLGGDSQAKPGPYSPAANLASNPSEPGANERVIVFNEGDRLYRVAEQYGVELQWLIRRNDLVRQPGPGSKLIVPNRGPAAP